MQEVSVGFSRPRKWWLPLAWIIRAVEGTPYSHVFIKFRHSSGIEVVYEASGISVQFKALSFFTVGNTTVKEYTFQVTKAQSKQLVSFMLANAGAEYGFKQLVGIALVKLFRLKSNPFADGRRSQVCSEVVGYFLEDVLRLETGLDLETAGPKDIDKYIQGIK